MLAETVIPIDPLVLYPDASLGSPPGSGEVLLRHGSAPPPGRYLACASEGRSPTLAILEIRSPGLDTPSVVRAAVVPLRSRDWIDTRALRLELVACLRPKPPATQIDAAAWRAA